MRLIVTLAALLICSNAWADEPAPEGPDGPSAAAHPGEEASEQEKGTPARVVRRALVTYPERALRERVEGTVKIRLFVDSTGQFVPRRDPECRWSSLSWKERRASFFHSRWCVEAVSGPKALRGGAVSDWTQAKFEPATDASGKPIRSYVDMSTSYTLGPRR